MNKFNVENAISKQDFEGIISYSELLNKIQQYKETLEQIQSNKEVQFLVQLSTPINTEKTKMQNYLDAYNEKKKQLDFLLLNSSTSDIEKMFEHPEADEKSIGHYGQPKYRREYDDIKKEYINIILQKELTILKELK